MFSFLIPSRFLNYLFACLFTICVYKKNRKTYSKSSSMLNVSTFVFHSSDLCEKSNYVYSGNNLPFFTVNEWSSTKTNLLRRFTFNMDFT